MIKKVAILSWLCFFAVNGKAEYVKYSYLPDYQREAKEIFDFKTGELRILKDKMKDDDENFRHIQKVGDLYYTSDRYFEGAIVVTSGIFNVYDKTTFEVSRSYSLPRENIGGYKCYLQGIKDEIIVLETANKDKVAVSILAIVKNKLHICWIMADEQTGLFSEDAKKELIEVVKKSHQYGKVASGEANIYHVESEEASYFCFGTQELKLIPKDIVFDFQARTKMSEDEFSKNNKKIRAFLSEQDMLYGYMGKKSVSFGSGRCYELKHGDINDLATAIKHRRYQSSYEPLSLKIGNVYLVKTIDAKYALIKIQYFDLESLNFAWLYQPDGSLNFPEDQIKSGFWDLPEPEPIDVTKVSLFDIYKNHDLSIEEKKKLIRQAVESGTDIETKDKQWGTILAYAVVNNSPEMVEFLISLKADVNFEANDWVCLHEAAKYGYFEICKLLVEAGADTTIPDFWGKTPVQIAMEQGQYTRNEELIGYLKAKTVANTLHLAAVLCDSKAANRLLEGGSNPNEYDKDGNTPLHKTAWSGSADVCKVLMDHGADPSLNAKGDWEKSALELAAKNGKSDVVRVMVGNYSFSAKMLASALLEASNHDGDSEVCRLLLEAGANSHYQFSSRAFSTPFNLALRNAPYPVLEVYFEYGEKLPLWAAAHRNMIDEVRTMLEGGADVNERNDEDMTPIACAFFADNLEVFKLLLKYHPEVNEPIGLSNKNLLQKIIGWHKTEFAVLLIEYGADVNIRDSIGKTPLYYAIKREDEKLIKILKEHGAHE